MADHAQRDVERMMAHSRSADRNIWRKMAGGTYYLSFLIALLILSTIWYFAAHMINKSFSLPYIEDVAAKLIFDLTDLYILRNLAITMGRVVKGVWYGILIGFPIGMLMGYSPLAMRTFAPFINSLRQIPTTAWVPLAIVWFGLGDGPTIFIICFHAVFTIILNTVSGVNSISNDYYNAVRSMGANTLNIICDVVLPGSISGLITGIRVALGSAWMSVV